MQLPFIATTDTGRTIEAKQFGNRVRIIVYGAKMMTGVELEWKHPLVAEARVNELIVQHSKKPRKVLRVGYNPYTKRKPVQIWDERDLDTWEESYKVYRDKLLHSSLWVKIDTFEKSLLIESGAGLAQSREAELASLQEQVATLTRVNDDLNGAVKAVKAVVATVWDTNDASVTIDDHRFMTETMNEIDAILSDVVQS